MAWEQLGNSLGIALKAGEVVDHQVVSKAVADIETRRQECSQHGQCRQLRLFGPHMLRTGEQCADLGLVYFFDSMHDSDCSATLNPHKSQPSWSHVFKTNQPEAAWK